MEQAADLARTPLGGSSGPPSGGSPRSDLPNGAAWSGITVQATVPDDPAFHGDRQDGGVLRRFAGRPDQVGAARRFVRALLSGRLAGPVAGDLVELLVSELATNAVEHTASGDGGAFRVGLVSRPGTLRVTVCDDGGSGCPRPAEPAADREAGRGLAMVELLAERWGVERTPHGHAVWFELPAEH